MVIAVLTVEYHLHGNDSLKGKRRVANNLKLEGAQHVQRRHRRIRHGGFPDPSPADGHFPEQQRSSTCNRGWTNASP